MPAPSYAIPPPPLPPTSLRWGGPRYADDEVYLMSAQQNARMLAAHCGLSGESAVLDIGCGPGRLLAGLLAEFGGIRRYVGLDVHAEAIEWAQEHLASCAPEVAFIRLDVQNDRYNRSGHQSDTTVRLPIDADSGPDAGFDVIVLFSVFSHMRLAGVRNYLSEVRRLVKPTGRVFLTAFTEVGAPYEEENPPNYRRAWKGALHCVRFNKSLFEHCLADADLRVVHFQWRSTSDGQSRYVLVRRDTPEERYAEE